MWAAFSARGSAVRLDGGFATPALFDELDRGSAAALLAEARIRAYVVKRQTDKEIVHRPYMVTRRDGTTRQVPERRRAIEGVSNAEINRELTILKRIFSLAIQAEKLLHKPHIPLLREDNTRTGFFEREQFDSVRGHLPSPLGPVVEFAYITGWRIASEVLPLQRRQIDLEAGEIRLDAGTTKTREGRVFPMTDDLRALFEAQYVEQRLKQAGQIAPWVSFRMIAGNLEAPPGFELAGFAG